MKKVTIEELKELSVKNNLLMFLRALIENDDLRHPDEIISFLEKPHKWIYEINELIENEVLE